MHNAYPFPLNFYVTFSFLPENVGTKFKNMAVNYGFGLGALKKNYKRFCIVFFFLKK